LVELLIEHATSTKCRESLKLLIEQGIPEGCDVIDVLRIAGDAPVSVTEFIETLEPLNPRLYSIASSMKKVGSEVHLTVGKVLHEREGRLRKGVASTMLAERIGKGETLRVFVQPNHGGFTVPTNPAAPMIMVGPGTGIAPFMAFLQEREATGADGPNWLFFGDQHEATDFLYKNDLRSYVASGLLSRLDTAFSRDGDKRVYVQDRMRENASELWRWIGQGASIYVCGDASRMANDVNLTLIDIIAQQGDMTTEQAESFIGKLKSDGRYARDVY
jgi:sulfite reductase (NADPH) flavoprotein alpha-component